MAIKFGIDGTGPMSNTTYAANFSNSHVKKICTGEGEYVRGPITPGGGLPEAIDAGLESIKAKRESEPESPILLTGFSRGGLGVVVIAKQLQRQDIPVRAMLLFDCVDRHLAYDASRIPTNVENVYHVRRDPAARSRMSFGNDGTKSSPPTVYNEKFFMCTHGSMGGTPWKPKPGQSSNEYINEGYGEAYISTGNAVRAVFYRTNITFAQDARVSQEVWRDVQPFARQHSFV
ncbi:MAG: hypothetical protein HKN25_17240 [Pyrinomonadaceae bacterium]|nr:hypothetical protein [Pyrinomonadaceae bacterium]